MEYYSHGLSVKLDNYMIIVYDCDNSIRCTIKNGNSILFDKIFLPEFEASYRNNSKNIIMLFLNTFILYKITFVSNDSAKIAFEKFFSKAL